MMDSKSEKALLINKNVYIYIYIYIFIYVCMYICIREICLQHVSAEMSHRQVILNI